jgi:Ca2+-binding RTX toxin-like protein
MLVLGAGALAATPAPAAEFTVTSIDDQVDGVLNGTCDTAGVGSECTLRAAVQESNRLSDADVITLPDLGPDYDLSLTGAGEEVAASGDLDLTQPVTIQGTGQPVIDGLGADRVLHLGPSGFPSVSLSGIEIRGGGSVEVGAGVYVEAGALSMSSVTVAGNTAASGAASATGGGISIDSAALHAIVASTISGNAAQGVASATGGGLSVGAGAGVSLTNSTVSGNNSTAAGGNAQGGGIASAGGTSLTHTTVHANGALATGTARGGSLLSSAGAIQLRATIVSSGTAGAGAQNCFSTGGGLNSLGFNLEAPDFATGAQCGTSSVAQDRFAADAALAVLADRGGPTQTHALLSNSLALDAIPTCFPLANDQRGESRPSGPACEIGSFERQVLAPPGAGCFGAAPTIIGSARADRIVGTPGPDVILGQAGKDLIKGREGKDLICAGKGDDRVYAGGSGDKLAGEDGKDRLFGQAGKDTLLGNGGRDVLSGGKGRDFLNGGGRRDNCRGSRGEKQKDC